MVNSNLIGEYVHFPNDGDAGWVRAVYVASEHLKVLIQRNNVSKDFKVYYAVDMEMSPEPK